MAKEEARYFTGSMTDRRHNSDGLAEYCKRFLSSGVWELTDNLAVSAESGMEVSVNFGASLVEGYLYKVVDNETGTLILTIDDADVQPRIDRVVVKKETSIQRVYCYIKKGTPNASPSPPALDRTGTAYEISLAQIAVGVGVTEILTGDITDEREDDAVCGIIGSKVGVNGPNSSVDGNIAVLNGMDGKSIKDSGKKPSDFLLLAGGKMTGKFKVKDEGSHFTQVGNSAVAGEGLLGVSVDGSTEYQAYVRIGQNSFKYSDGTTQYKIWHEGNDGHGSGLDADMVSNIFRLHSSGQAAGGTGTISLTSDAVADAGTYLVVVKLMGGSGTVKESGLLLWTHYTAGDNVAVVHTPQYYVSATVSSAKITVTINALSWTYLYVYVWRIA